MENEPRKLPARYKKRFNSKLNEWQVLKRYRYIDENGNKKDTETRWHSTIEECETEAREKTEGTFKKEVKAKASVTVGSTFDDYLNELKADAAKITNVKNSSAIEKYSVVRALRTKYTPAFIENTPIKRLSPEVFSKWVAWINSDVVGHNKLSGIRVRAFKNQIKSYTEYLVANGFLTYDNYIFITVALKDQKLKKKTAGKRNNRYMPTFDDLQNIKKYYREQKGGLGSFENFYWYTFWIVLFCTGMRVGEIVALQWRDITFSDVAKDNVIHINNAINDKEIRENEMAVIKANNLETKNKNSVRNITMWAYYKQLFKDYQHSFKCQYGIERISDLEDCFVFPNITSLTDKLEYQRQKNILRELKRVCERTGIPETDAQMFRHACAYFLAYEQGYAIEDTHDYFGHCDSTMIRQVYAPLSAEEKRKKQAMNHHSLITEEEIYFDDQHSKLAYRVKPGENLNRTTNYARKERELAQIKRVIEMGRDNYYYSNDFADLINEIIEENPDFKNSINFILEDE